jgi:ACT domain-containing protein
MGKYEKLIKPNLTKIKKWRKGGMKIGDIAKCLNVSSSLFYKYKAERKELADVLAAAETALDLGMVERAEKSLFDKLEDRMALVETFTEFWEDAEGKVIKTHTVKREKLIQADITAVIFALKARVPEKWNALEARLVGLRGDRLEQEIKSGGADDVRKLIADRLGSYMDDGREALS